MGAVWLLPPHQGGAPGKAATHGLHQHQATFLKKMVLKRLIERQRNRCRRGITVLGKGNYHLLARNFEALGDSVENASVSLVRHVEVDLAGRVTGHYQGYF